MISEKQFRKKRWVVLLLILAVTVCCIFNFKNIRVESNFETLFDNSDEETTYFNTFRDQFQPENDYFLLILKSETNIFNPKFLSAANSLTKQIEGLSNVEQVFSITNQSEVQFSTFNILNLVPYLSENRNTFQLDSSRVYSNKELVKTLVSDDAKSISILIKYEDYLEKAPTQKLINEIKSLVNQSVIADYCMFGKTYGQYYISAKMQRDMTVFFGIGLGLIILFLLFTFRSIWGVLVPQLIIILALVWLLGGLGIFNEPINLLLTVMPILMLVVSMSDVIHLVTRYLDLKNEAATNYKALMQAIKEVGLATFLTSITTAVGFYSLCFISIAPIQNFGLVLGTGVLIAFALTFGLLPVLFYWFPGPNLKLKKYGKNLWDIRLKQLFVFTFRNQKSIYLGAVIIVVTALVGANQLSANNYTMPGLSPADPFAKDMQYIDSHYGGIRSFVMTASLKSSKKSFNDLEVLRDLNVIQEYLEVEYGVTIRSSIISAFKVLNRSKTGEFILPDKRLEVRQFYKYIAKAEKGKLLAQLVDSSEQTAQITGFIKDDGSKVVFKKNEALFDYITKRQSQYLDFKLTGTTHLVDKNVQFLVENMLYGLAISIGMVALIIGFVFRSVRIVLISLIPNLIPILLVAALMGFTGIELKLSTIIIFSIAFGIVVDDTIHFLGKFKYELSKGITTLKAIENCYKTTGKAMLLTTVILCLGFGVMCFSSFVGTYQLGILLTVALVTAVIVDLILLPLLLFHFYPQKNKNT